MRDKDAHLIFENYLTSKSDVILEADGKKWEDESSLWSWIKTFDPTGFSSYPDVVEAYYGVRENPADVGPWAFLLLQIFLALPNFGLLAAGIGGIGWAGLRAAAKSAIKAGPSSPAVHNIAEKILKYATETKWFQAILIKFGEILKQKGVTNPKLHQIYEDMITSGNFAKLGSKEPALAVAAKETIGSGFKNLKFAGIKPFGTGAQLSQYAGRAGMSKADEVKAEIEKFKQNANKGSNKGQGPTKETAAKGEFAIGKRTPRGKEEPTPQKPKPSTTPQTKSKSKFAYENL